MVKLKGISFVITLILIIAAVGCEKKLTDEEKQELSGTLLSRIDKDGNNEYYIEGCEELNVDTVGTEEGLLYTFTGCGKTVRYISKDAWHYNCYPVYDYWGYYLYDDCYWENYWEFDLEKDSLISKVVIDL